MLTRKLFCVWRGMHLGGASSLVLKVLFSLLSLFDLQKKAIYSVILGRAENVKMLVAWCKGLAR
jgi:hypothetical protein